MKPMNLFTRLGIVLVTLASIGCTDSSREPGPFTHAAKGITFTQPGTLRLHFKHLFGAEAFALAPASFVTAATDTIRVEQFDYYISNIVLTGANGSRVPLPGYFLQTYLNGKPNTITLQQVPVGHYTAITFLLGVDSAANATAQHNGDLDPAYGMFWTWSTGYKFMRLNGTHSFENKAYSFEIGGTQNGVTYTHNLLAYQVKGNTVNATFHVDLARIFNTPNVYDLKANPNAIHTGHDPGIEKMTANMQTAITIAEVQ